MGFKAHSLQKLKEKGYKITGPRVAVMEAVEAAKTPLSPYDIQQRLPKNVPVNVVTIYRVLDLLQELGLVHRLHTKEGYVRCFYEHEKGCHFFAVCEKCGQYREFIQSSCKIENIIPKDLPFVNLKHMSEISGICKQCQAGKKSASGSNRPLS
jgi:Fur family zinc uptake transcriptional regulator